MKIIGTKGKALSKVVRTPSAGPRASIPQEGEAARRGTDEDGVASVETSISGQCRHRVVVWLTERLPQ